MTREEAAATLSKAIEGNNSKGRAFAPKWIAAFEALGMLKLDKPEDKARAAAIELLAAGIGQLSATNQIDTLLMHGFKITR